MSSADARAVPSVAPLLDDLTPRDAAIVAAYRAGKSLAEIARRAHMSGETVRQVLDRAGVQIRRPGRPKRRATTDDLKPRDAAIVAAYRAGKSLTAIGVRAHMSGETVQQVLVRAGVQIRRPGRPRKTRNAQADRPPCPTAVPSPSPEKIRRPRM